MSDSTVPEPTQPLPEPQDQADPPLDSPRSRRWLIVATVAAMLVVILAGGAWALWKLLDGGGPQPDEALPASTVALVSIDLDPSASQKIEAFQTLRKFPALKKSLGLSSGDDLRKYIFDKALGGDDCADATYDKSLAPWVGERVGIALVDLGEKSPVPAIALAVSDKEKAAKGFQQILDCAGLDDEVGYVVGKDYLIASDSRAHATSIRDAGIKHPLAKDATYQDWTDRVGDRGVVNFYVSKKAGSLASDALSGFGDRLAGGSLDGFADPSGQAGCAGDPVTSLTRQLTAFSGFAGTIRFADGGMELSVVDAGEKNDTRATVGRRVASLPADSSLVLGAAVPSNSGKTFLDGLAQQTEQTCVVDGDAGGSLVDQFQEKTGLSLPDDLTTLLGSALTFSIGGDVPLHLDETDGPADLPIGLVVDGDGTKIRDLISKVERHLGGTLADGGIEVRSAEDRVVITTSGSYAAELEKSGKLGDQSSFADAVPNADDASVIFYVNFRSGLRDALLQLIADEGESSSDVKAARENTDPLKALGISAWHDDDGGHFLVKITTG